MPETVNCGFDPARKHQVLPVKEVDCGFNPKSEKARPGTESSSSAAAPPIGDGKEVDHGVAAAGKKRRD